MNNGCQRVSSLCSNSYDRTNGNCLGCSNGYTLINGQCIDLNCLSQNEANCIQCRSNFRIISPSTLCTFYDLNCVSASTTACLQCINGYKTASNGLCTAEGSTQPITPVNNST